MRADVLARSQECYRRQQRHHKFEWTEHDGEFAQRVCILCAIISICASIVGGPRTNHALRMASLPLWMRQRSLLSSCGRTAACCHARVPVHSGRAEVLFAEDVFEHTSNKAGRVAFSYPAACREQGLAHRVGDASSCPVANHRVFTADVNGFADSVVLGLVCRLSLPGSHFQKERIQRLVALRHLCHHAFFVTSRTRQSRSSSTAW